MLRGSSGGVYLRGGIHGEPFRFVWTLSFVVWGLLTAASLSGDCGSYCPFCPPPAAYASATPTTVCAGEGVVLVGGYKNCLWGPAGAIAIRCPA